ncbi:MAG: DUF1508 domain-containing protein [Gammaproteobacteria bacterium]|nr:DUF1508 domain-containing protein [Gammaproteobacteria bacterium]
MPGKFELYKDVRDRYRFRLISEKGELILSGDGYKQKVLALDAIVSIMRSASEAAVIDLSLQQRQEMPGGDDGIELEEAWDEAEEEALWEPAEKRRKRKKRGKGGKKARADRKSRRGR